MAGHGPALLLLPVSSSAHRGTDNVAPPRTPAFLFHATAPPHSPPALLRQGSSQHGRKPERRSPPSRPPPPPPGPVTPSPSAPGPGPGADRRPAAWSRRRGRAPSRATRAPSWRQRRGTERSERAGRGGARHLTRAGHVSGTAAPERKERNRFRRARSLAGRPDSRQRTT